MFLDLAISALAACAITVFIFAGVPMVSALDGAATDTDWGEVLYVIQMRTYVHCHYVNNVFQSPTLEGWTWVNCPPPNILLSFSYSYGFSDHYCYQDGDAWARSIWNTYHHLYVKSEISTPS